MGSKNPAQNDNNVADNAALQILVDLGIQDAIDPPPLKVHTTRDTEEIIADPDEWHPLKNTNSSLMPQTQSLLIGSDYSGSFNTLIEDRDNGFSGSWSSLTSSPITDDQSWEKNANNTSVSGDFDGDGIDEFYIFSTLDDGATLSVRYMDGDSTRELSAITGRVEGRVSMKERGFNDPGINRFYYTSKSFMAKPCQLDNDDEEELILVLGKMVSLWNVNPQSGALSYLDSKEMPELVTTVSVGDMTGNNIDEIAVTLFNGSSNNGASFYLFQDGSFLYSLINPDRVYFSGYPVAEAAMGDYNGDRVQELAICALSDEKNVDIFWYNFNGSSLQREGPEQIPSFFIGTKTTLSSLSINMDSTVQDELYCCGLLFEKGGLSNSDVQALMSINDEIMSITAKKGDSNKDGKEDLSLLIIKFSAENGYEQYYRTIWFNSAEQVEFKKINMGSIYNANAQTICTGNLRGNTPRVVFQDHDFRFTNPIVLAVMASPPYYSSIAESDEVYEFGNWETTYGTSSSVENSNENSIGFSAGVTIEVEQELSIFGINLLNVQTSASFTAGMDWRVSTAYQETYSTSYSCIGGEDRVIFSSLPMDTYRYRLYEENEGTSGDYSMVEISIPRKVQTYSVTLDFFNENNGEVKDLVMEHEIGLVDTYLSVSEKNEKINRPGLVTYEGNSNPVGQANNDSDGGSTYVEINYSDSDAQTFGVNTETEVSAGGGAGGVTILGTLGFQTSYSYSTTFSQGTSFGGTIGYLPSDYYTDSDYFFNSGLVAYQEKQAETGQTYWVVTYWVE